MISKEKKREVLRTLGYVRRDRTQNKVHIELWVHQNHPNCNNGGASLESCWKHALRHGFIRISEIGEVAYHSDDP